MFNWKYFTVIKKQFIRFSLFGQITYKDSFRLISLMIWIVDTETNDFENKLWRKFTKLYPMIQTIKMKYNLSEIITMSMDIVTDELK